MVTSIVGLPALLEVLCAPCFQREGTISFRSLDWGQHLLAGRSYFPHENFRKHRRMFQSQRQLEEHQSLAPYLFIVALRPLLHLMLASQDIKMNSTDTTIKQIGCCVILGGQKHKIGLRIHVLAALEVFPQGDNSPCLPFPSLPHTTDNNWP